MPLNRVQRAPQGGGGNVNVKVDAPDPWVEFAKVALAELMRAGTAGLTYTKMAAEAAAYADAMMAEMEPRGPA